MEEERQRRVEEAERIANLSEKVQTLESFCRTNTKGRQMSIREFKDYC
jgi:hypothetical protein